MADDFLKVAAKLAAKAWGGRWTASEVKADEQTPQCKPQSVE
jgi:hypothetical protein